MKRSLFIFCALLCALTAHCQIDQILGDWYTVDDKTGYSFARVTIFKATNGKYYGKIAEIIWPGAEDQVCVNCEGADHNKPIAGMLIIRDMEEKDGELVGGKCLDPDNGKFYYAKLYIKDGKLVLRGSLDKRGILGRNQTWQKQPVKKK